MIRATFELEPEGSAEALAVMESTGMVAGPAPPGQSGRYSPEAVRGRVISEGRGRAVVDFPETNWAGSVGLLVSALVAGEATEAAAFTRCRLVDLELPDGVLPGPAFGAGTSIDVGLIVKPSLGLRPPEVADVVGAAAAGGTRFVKDDELLGDPPWCPLDDRVKAVAQVLPPSVVYCANVTGSSEGLLDRAWRAVDLGPDGLEAAVRAAVTAVGPP